jgi:sporulation protein YlmC with PRC-barrel domain
LSSKESGKYVPTQRFAGMQVVNIKGVVVGNVKDVSVDFQNKALAFRVTTRNKTELDVGWDDILSLEDIVLLKKNVDLPTSAPPTTPTPPPPATGQARVICSSCGASSPARAKFCPKCGASFKQTT